MTISRLKLGLIGCLSLTGLCLGTARGQVQAPSFDKLNEADRIAFGERFQREVWPLLTAGGKDGCAGCHNGKKVTSLRFRGNPQTDFRTLLKEGFFLKDDAGSLLDRILDRAKDRRMPPGDLPRWSEEQVRVLRQFVNDLDKKNGG